MPFTTVIIEVATAVREKCFALIPPRVRASSCRLQPVFYVRDVSLDGRRPARDRRSSRLAA